MDLFSKIPIVRQEVTDSSFTVSNPKNETRNFLRITKQWSILPPEVGGYPLEEIFQKRFVQGDMRILALKSLLDWKTSIPMIPPCFVEKVDEKNPSLWF